MNSKKNIDVWLTFGDDSEEKKILEFNGILQIGNQDKQLSKFMIKEHHALEDDLMIMLKFRVAPGREKQASQYLQKGMDQLNAFQQECLNPLQKILKRPKSSGRVFFAQQEGIVIIYYNFYMENLGIQQLLDNLKSFKNNQSHQQTKIYINAFVRGQQQKSLKEKTTILPNYTEITFQSSNIDFQRIVKLLHIFQFVPQELVQAPFIKMLTKNIKKIRMKANLNTLRKLSRMYNEIGKVDGKTHSDPYIHKNLLKNQVQMTVSWKPLGIAKGSLLFRHEDHMHRIVRKLSLGFITYQYQ